MSRIGKAVIKMPESVKYVSNGGVISFSGPKGAFSVVIPNAILLSFDHTELSVSLNNTHKNNKSLHGLFRSIIQNAIHGVSTGFEKKLELSGVGYQVQLKNSCVELHVGYSKPVIHPIPSSLSVTAPDSTHIVVSGVDKQLVGQFSATLRASREPDPYKAKGVKYSGELIRRKAGKAFGAGAK